MGVPGIRGIGGLPGITGTKDAPLSPSLVIDSQASTQLLKPSEGLQQIPTADSLKVSVIKCRNFCVSLSRR